MLVAMRRLFWLMVLGGAAFAAWSVVQQRRRQTVDAVAPAPESFASATVSDIPIAFTELADDEHDAHDAPGDPTWMAPVDGACPDGYPIKVNASSGIYHVPGGRFYDRMIPHRCYAHTADADADGYRRAKA
jgi:hypothetical protein